MTSEPFDIQAWLESDPTLEVLDVDEPERERLTERSIALWIEAGGLL